ncbi:MAG: hypothetical protein ACHQXK_04260 [Methanosarcina thermophila]|jgi:hypothetical protein|uniref:Uncharacterized protein n=3 Tax=Methanosarcina thermophila TaxID=2210 RepID=A0A1I6ZMW2_METTE|nr:hypothetical protein [Methanosarcina thermophila]AKB13702.1 hypothetical protein MSTHT_1944 [Methanosarcina thermophila TM-1]AKB15657.1 hypothetical protein MSTHC_1339 [Methanosarcina thermophila CHTI-55]NLU57627.1 hypothetical protein [Methanosarcina thermophila]SFT63961.1 hypothetical protein SAMN02910340_01595 [Methanosarcina thermophila]BAW28720.1 conserved hypothetical protein [Methanosarcina thermophila]
MSNTTKLLMIILMVVTAVVVVQLINQPMGEKGAVQQEIIMGKGSLDAFVSESHNYEDRFLFTYTPKNPDSRFNCYMSYEFRENGNALENVSEKFYENVSVENPIVLEFPRKENSTYELKTLIEDKSGINLYKSEIKISPSTIENETEIK